MPLFCFTVLYIGTPYNVTGLHLDAEHATYTVKVAIHTDGLHYSSPDGVETCTITIAPKVPRNDDDDDGKEENRQTCTFSWTMAYMGTGLCSTIFVLLFKACLLGSLERYLDKEMQYYYEEAIRRTEQPKPNEE